MKFISIARTMLRYWRMANDPRTPAFVKWLIYGGIAYSLSPVDLIPDWVPGLGLVDDAAVLPGIIAVAMLMIPQEVKDAHDAKAEKGIQRKQVEGIQQRDEEDKPQQIVT